MASCRPAPQSSLPVLSFEFFPPRNEEARKKLHQVAGKLCRQRPGFVSVTYGAGGSAAEGTRQTAMALAVDLGVPVACHLTYINAPVDVMEDIAHTLWEGGIRHIVALRGDMPPGLAWPLDPDPAYFQYTNDFVARLKQWHDFEISVGAYPEKHPDAPDMKSDLAALKKKCDAGATRAITQFFFENETYFRFVDSCRAARIDCPIVPGILPIANYEKMLRFATSCQASVPDWVKEKFDRAAPEDHDSIALDILIEQCRGLVDAGVTHLHFYTLNRSRLIDGLCAQLFTDKSD